MLMHRQRRTIVLLLTTFLFLSLCMVLGFSPMQSDPFQSPYLDNQAHTVGANSDTWFKFDYALNGSTRTLVTITMVNGTGTGLGFEVWAPEIMDQWWLKTPTGKGLPQPIDCATGAPLGGGECRSKDLRWIGAFGSLGTYYVRVVNKTASSLQFLLTVQGTSVTLGSNLAVRAAQPTATRAAGSASAPPSRVPTSAPALPTPINDPYRAPDLDGQVHTLPGNSGQWFKFFYGTPGDLSNRPQIGLRLIRADGTGLGFEVWTPDRLNEWWIGTPVGRGTPEMALACECQHWPTLTPFPEGQATFTPTPTNTPAPTPTKTPEVPCTHTPTGDLTWFGAFNGPGVYYVRVVNTTPFAMNYQLVQWQ